MDIYAEIKAIKYTPFLCKQIIEVDYSNISNALSEHSSFILNMPNKNKFAVSWWVSPKRTRSYPYARIYDTLTFSGKIITVIPVFKDEGKDGDRDFLQWDTVSLMSLLGIYTIVSYYDEATKNKEYENKITEQRFNISHIKSELDELLNFKSDALHWNLQQIDKIGRTGQTAIDSYVSTSKRVRVEMHSIDSAQKRILKLLKGKETFLELSRNLAYKAQQREVDVIQPKELLSGKKASINIKNYLGGYYYLTVDEALIKEDKIFLIEGKHSKNVILPSTEDIKDGLLKMALFTNLSELKVGGKTYDHFPILKLTSAIDFTPDKLNDSQKRTLELLKKESKTNNFGFEYFHQTG